MDFEEIKNKAKDELEEILVKTQKDLRRLSAKAKLNQLKQVHQVRILRKTVARLKTWLSR